MATASLGGQFRLTSWDGYTSEARAVLRDRNHELVLLPASDEVQVTNGEWQIELVPLTADRWYESFVPSVPAGEWHNFAVLREGRPSAGYNEVMMPLDPLPVVPPAWSRSGELVVAWAGVQSDEPIAIALDGSCLDRAVVVEVPDQPGAHVFPAGAIGGEGSCEVLVTVSRVTRGPVDDELRGGSVEAWQRRTASVASDP